MILEETETEAEMETAEAAAETAETVTTRMVENGRNGEGSGR
jgi:hypothetical protein